MPDEPQAPEPTPGQKGQNIVTRKLGPLPVWAWVVIGAGGLLVLTRLRKGSSGSASSGPTSATMGSTLTPEQASLASSNQQLASGLSDLNSQLAISQNEATRQNGVLAGMAAAVAGIPQAVAAAIAAGQPAVTTNTGSVAGQLAPNPHALGSFWGVPDPNWAAGKGEFYLSAPDLYGAGKGAGANEIAAYINNLNPGAGVTPQQIADWNKGQKWYTSGQQLYVGSFAKGMGH